MESHVLSRINNFFPFVAVFVLVFFQAPVFADDTKNLYGCPGGCADSFSCGKTGCKCGCQSGNGDSECAQAKQFLRDRETNLSADREKEIKDMNCTVAATLARAYGWKSPAEIRQKEIEEEKAKKAAAEAKAKADFERMKRKAEAEAFYAKLAAERATFHDKFHAAGPATKPVRLDPADRIANENAEIDREKTKATDDKRAELLSKLRAVEAGITLGKKRQADDPPPGVFDYSKMVRDDEHGGLYGPADNSRAFREWEARHEADNLFGLDKEQKQLLAQLKSLNATGDARSPESIAATKQALENGEILHGLLSDVGNIRPDSKDAHAITPPLLITGSDAPVTHYILLYPGTDGNDVTKLMPFLPNSTTHSKAGDYSDRGVTGTFAVPNTAEAARRFVETQIGPDDKIVVLPMVAGSKGVLGTWNGEHSEGIRAAAAHESVGVIQQIPADAKIWAFSWSLGASVAIDGFKEANRPIDVFVSFADPGIVSAPSNAVGHHYNIYVEDDKVRSTAGNSGFGIVSPQKSPGTATNAINISIAPQDLSLMFPPGPVASHTVTTNPSFLETYAWPALIRARSRELSDSANTIPH